MGRLETDQELGGAVDVDVGGHERIPKLLALS